MGPFGGADASPAYPSTSSKKILPNFFEGMICIDYIKRINYINRMNDIKHIQLKLPAELHRALKQQALDTATSLQNVCITQLSILAGSKVVSTPKVPEKAFLEVRDEPAAFTELCSIHDDQYMKECKQCGLIVEQLKTNGVRI